MTHIAIQEKLDGKVVDWIEQVSDETIPRRDVRGAARALDASVVLEQFRVH
jgi:hypothetical protein